MAITLYYRQGKEGLEMGSYVERYWISDASGMNKAERIGGAYRPSEA
jgi:hypothetical protein